MDSSSILAATALIAVVVGPLVTIYVARKQFRAEVLSHNRQGWINAVREHIAKIITLIEHIHRWHEQEDGDPNALNLKHEELSLLEERLALLLNPAEADHSELLELVSLGIAAVSAGESVGSYQEIRGHERTIRTKTQGILKREWERVKRGK